MKKFKTMKKLFFLTLIAAFCSNGVSGQQDPHYTQYMYNMSIINPAYAGSKENLSAGILYRKQWVDIEGAPTTATMFVHSPIGKNIGLGISAISDKIGPVDEKNVYADVSYTLNVTENAKLAFGLKAGATFHTIDFGAINPSLPVLDPVFASSNPNSNSFNLGTGLFYYTNKYYIAVSVPNILKSKYLDFNGRSYGTEVSHYFITGGYVFDLTPTIKFKPFMMVKSSFNAPTSVDASTNFLFNDRFEIGATYRFQDSFGGMVNFAITPNLRVGYAYDHIVSDLKIATPSSHEFILLFDLNFPKKISQSPRYF